MAPKLTTTVIDALRSSGYQVEVLEDLTRPADSPDDVDYEKTRLPMLN
jgi:nicotinamidase-related amidase